MSQVRVPEAVSLHTLALGHEAPERRAHGTDDDEVDNDNDKGLSIYYVSSYNKAGSFRMLTNAYLREQGFIQKLMSYENPH